MKHLDTRLPVSEEERSRLEERCREYASNALSIHQLNKDAKKRFAAESPYGIDGIKRHHKSGDRIRPFKGSANNAIRWADAIADAERSMAIEIARRVNLVVRPITADEMSTRHAAALTKLIDWGISALGNERYRQLEMAVNYALIDTPAIALLTLDWQTRTIHGPRVAQKDQVAAALLSALSDISADDLDNAILIGDIPERISVAAATILSTYTETAERVLRAFAEDNQVEYIARVAREEVPALNAWQFGTEFLIPSKTCDFQFLSPWYRVEWVSIPRLYDLAEAGGWSNEFVEATIKCKGQSLNLATEDTFRVSDDYREMVQLCYAYTIDETATGETARWQTIFSAAPGLTACGREIMRINKAKWPAVLLTRERNSDNLLDSRGLALLASPALDLAKKLVDTGSNNAIVGGLPPVLSRGNGEQQISLNPLAAIKLRSNAELKFLQPPAYPAQGNNEVNRLKSELYDYFGIATKDSDLETITTRRRHRMGTFIGVLRDLYMALLSLIQTNASDALLARILGNDATLPGIRTDIDGHFTLTLECNVDDLITENVIKKIQVFGQIIGTLDRQKVVDTAPIMKSAIRALFPDVSEDALRAVEDATQADLKDEEENFIKIKAGLRPQMNVEGGWNYAARLQFWQEQLQQNPAAIEEMSPEAQAFAQQWMQALQQQDQQFGANAELGRTGAPDVEPMA